MVVTGLSKAKVGHRGGMFAAMACVFVLTLGVRCAFADEEIVASGCFVKLKEEASIPARDRGVLMSLDVQPGTFVKKGDRLGTLDSVEAGLARDAAHIELDAAKRARDLSLAVEIASANTAESRASLDQAKVDAEVAQTIAESDLAVRTAEAALELADEELKRGLAARERFASSVSEVEILRLQLKQREKSLELDNAKQDQGVAALRAKSANAGVVQQGKVVDRLALELKSVKNDRELEAMNIARLEKAVALAEEHVARRQLVASIPGLVVERFRELGEWLEPGEPVVRIARLDQLYVEGYMPAASVSQSTVGMTVSVEVRVADADGSDADVRMLSREARVVFVSPEVDRVNREVLVRAEIDNADLRLRPGLPAKMTLRRIDARISRGGQ